MVDQYCVETPTHSFHAFEFNKKIKMFIVADEILEWWSFCQIWKFRLKKKKLKVSNERQYWFLVFNFFFFVLLWNCYVFLIINKLMSIWKCRIVSIRNRNILAKLLKSEYDYSRNKAVAYRHKTERKAVCYWKCKYNSKKLLNQIEMQPGRARTQVKLFPMQIEP